MASKAKDPEREALIRRASLRAWMSCAASEVYAGNGDQLADSLRRNVDQDGLRELAERARDLLNLFEGLIPEARQ
jgi:hypothetical protein